MKLTQLRLYNYRCFEALEVSLQRDVNVFVGVNGAGKSTLLDGLAAALGMAIPFHKASAPKLSENDFSVTPSGVAKFCSFYCEAELELDFFGLESIFGRVNWSNAAGEEESLPDHFLQANFPAELLKAESKVSKKWGVFAYYKAVVEEVMGLGSQRPPNNSITDSIRRLFEALDDGELEEAQSERAKLANWAGGYPEPDLVKADLLIRRLHNIKKRQDQPAA